MRTADDTWKTVAAINLNAQYSWLQTLGAALHTRSGSLGAYSQPVQLRVNNANLAGTSERTYGSYAANEVPDADWADRHLPNDGEGNVYRALRDITPPEFDYRTLAAYPGLYGPEDKRSYTNTWFKGSNASEDDWTDLIGMLRVFGPNGTEPYTDDSVRRVFNVEEALRNLAIMNLLGNGETALNTGYNDDYVLYRGINDPRFLLMYYDLDQILGYNGSLATTASLFTAAGDNGSGRAFGRFIQAPQFQPIFLRIFQELLNTTFSQSQFDALVDQTLGDFVPDVARTQVKSWMNSRRAYVQSQLPPVTSDKQPLASVTGTPRSPSPSASATLVVGGEGIAQYSYSLNGAPFGAAFPVSTPIILTGLPAGSNWVAVIGRNAAGAYQSSMSPTVVGWVVNTSWPTVRLNEISASRSGNVRDQVELFNEGSAAVNLAGMRLTDNLNVPDKYTFGQVLLQPGAYLVLDSNQLGFALEAKGEAIYLLDSSARGGVLLDSIVFGLQVTDLSLGRVGSGGEWQLTVPTFGTTNVLQPLGNLTYVRINEWLASGVAPFPDDFVELYNPNSLPVAIGGCYLTDKLYGAPTQSLIFPLSFIPAGGYVAFKSGNGKQADEINFGLAAEQGEIALLAPDLSVIDAMLYSAQSAGVSMGRCPDGASSQKALEVPTPGGPNQCPYTAPAPISITLLAFTNIWKYSSGTDLGTAWRATNYNDSAWGAGPGVLGFETAVLPEPLLTQLASGQITYYFRTTFKVPAGLAASSLQITALIDDGVAYYLNGQEVGSRYNLASDAGNQTFASGTVGDAAYQVFTIPSTLLRSGDNWFAAEVHQVSRTSSDMVFGMKLDALVATNTLAQSSVVINEVFPNNSTFVDVDGAAPDWVELYNASSDSVDLAGMSLSDDPGSPQRWVFPAGSLMVGKAFFKVRCNADLAASATNSGFGLAANGGAVYLFRRSEDGGGIQSSVVYGLMPADWSIGRVPDGGSNWVLTLPTIGIANSAASLGRPELLKINEWMADPVSGDDWFELFNPNPEPVQLSGMGLTDNLLTPLKHVLPPLSFIGNAGFLKFVADENPAAGADHVNYKLSPSGEALGISLPNAVLIDAVTFGPQLPGVSEGRLPDGGTRIVEFSVSPTPAASNYLPLSDIVVNELLSHTDPPLEDAVEFHNLTADGLNLGGWFLSDSAQNLRKYQVPANTIIPPRGFAVFYEGSFNSDAAAERFSFNSAKGDEVFLSQAINGVLTGYRAAASFGPAANGVSFGRFVTSQGADFVPMAARTFGVDNPATTNEFRLGTGAPNTYPKVGPVVISEIMYHPAITNDALEFIELYNLSDQPVPLYDPSHPENSWRIRNAVEMNLPPGITVPARSSVVLVSFNPETDAAALGLFHSVYGNSARLIGPYANKLDNAGETIELYKPDPPQQVGMPDAGLVPYVLVEQVSYADHAPWPASADGQGHSLQRIDLSLYGNEPANWTTGAPTPGTVDSDADGMPDAWEVTHGLNPMSAVDAQRDDDGDGFANVREYQLGTDPRSASSSFEPTLSRSETGGVALEFQAQPGRSYTIESSTDTAIGNWQLLIAVPAVAYEQILSLPVANNGKAMFLRVQSITGSKP